MNNNALLITINNILDEEISYENKFYKIASVLMNEYNLVIENRIFRITEIEFYYFDKNKHNDYYVHCNEKQKEFGKFYVHKKNGNYGGIDFTIGNVEKEIYGGILLRGFQSENEEIISGPNLLKKEVYKCLNVDNYKRLQESIDYNEKSMFFRKNKELASEKVFYSTRIGLKPNPKDYLTNEKFIYKLYRFAIFNTPQHKCKEKTNLKEYTKMNIFDTNI